MKIATKRVYEPASSKDGLRVLVDRVWPRGLSKDKAKIDLWLKEAAPSTSLRKWFGHDPEKWSEFKERYLAEIKKNKESLAPLKELLKSERPKKLTLIYGARDTEHNNAVVLQKYLEKSLK